MEPIKATQSSSGSLFGNQQFTSAEKEKIRNLLQQKLGVNDTTTRPGAGGGEYTYVESWKSTELANDIFGYNGWSCSIVDITPDFIEEEKDKYRCGISAVVRVSLKDGCFHEDVGYGVAENKSKGTAIENAKKSAVSDARKRALRMFGNLLGNCLYDKEHLKKLKSQKKNPTSSSSVNNVNNDIKPPIPPSMGKPPTSMPSNPQVQNNQNRNPMNQGNSFPNQNQFKQPTNLNPVKPDPYQQSYPDSSQFHLQNTQTTQDMIYNSMNLDQSHQTAINDHNDYGFADEFDYDEAFLLEAEAQTGQVRKQSPSEEEYKSNTPPDKKRKPTVEVH